MARILALLLLAVAPAALAQQPPLPVVELSTGLYRIHAELADRDETRSIGLMRRTSLAPSSGMLFLFDASAEYCMWMKNTLLPLSVAFIDEGGTIVNIEDMQPQTEDSHCAARPVRFALEMAQGWFAQRGIRAGSRLRGVEPLLPR